VTAVAAMLAALGFPSLVIWLLKARQARGKAREELIEILRKALDKGRVRENAYCGALDASFQRSTARGSAAGTDRCAS
jgi:hypothetical protein